jgi:phosphonate transport system ATP-binding protein
MHLFQIENVSKTYQQSQRGAVKALDNVSLRMDGPQILGLIGPSGSGKSTLLRILGGLSPSDKGAGSVTVLDTEVQSRGQLGSNVRAARAQMGLIAQQFNLVGRLSLFTNVALGLLGRISFWRGLLGLWTSAEKQEIMQALSAVKIDAMAAQRANTLSGGQQQRGAIARALVQKARLVLADEPIASLDPLSAHSVMRTLCALKSEQSIGVVITLHQIDHAFRYCERIVALKEGHIVYDGPPKDLDVQKLRAIYGDNLEEVAVGLDKEFGIA